MDRLTHTAWSAMRSLTQRQAQVANNLANVATPGFRADLMNAEARYLVRPGLSDRALTSGGLSGIDLGSGAVSETGRALDIAVEGSALLAVQGADGQEAYTRRGDLSIGATGLLETGDGHLVLGEAGPISVPPHDAMRIAPDGRLLATPPGGGEEIAAGRLRLVSPAGSPLARGLDGLLVVPGGGALPEDPAARVRPAALEGSNVTSSTALVDMISVARGYETQVRLLSTARELDEGGVALMRLPS